MSFTRAIFIDMFARFYGGTNFYGALFSLAFNNSNIILDPQFLSQYHNLIRYDIKLDKLKLNYDKHIQLNKI